MSFETLNIFILASLDIGLRPDYIASLFKCIYMFLESLLLYRRPVFKFVHKKSAYRLFYLCGSSRIEPRLSSNKRATEQLIV